MAETSKPTKAAKVTAPAPERSTGAPKFGMCQGTREEIERTGKAVDPFTGKTLTRDDL
jgi:hypothetical protein